MSVLKRILQCKKMMWGLGNSYPYYVNFLITYKCNSRCQTCGIWKYHLFSERKELSTTQIMRILLDMPEPVWLTLGGGEVFLREDLCRIVSAVWNYYPNLYGLGISTNGLLTDKIVESTAEMLWDKRNLRVSVSIDGYEDENDTIRGVAGAYTKAMDTYNQLKQLEEGHPHFTTGVSYTISSFNAGELEDFCDITGVIPDISLAHRGDPAFNNELEIDYLIDDDHRELVMNDLNYLLKQYKISDPRSVLKRIFIKKMKQYVKDPNRMVLPCSSLCASVFIDPFGVMFPCTIWSQPLGSLLKYSFEELWKSEQSQYARELIKKQKCPICWSGCESSHTILQSMPFILKDVF